ncbi:hypothetical protein ACOME3_002414 [Neoechinorhynchus agilis]
MNNSIKEKLHMFYFLPFGPFYLLYLIRKGLIQLNSTYLFLFGPFYLLYLIFSGQVVANKLYLVLLGPLYLLYMLMNGDFNLRKQGSWKKIEAFLLEESMKSADQMPLSFNGKEVMEDTPMKIEDVKSSPAIGLDMQGNFRMTFVLLDIGTADSNSGTGLPYLQYLVMNINGKGNEGRELFSYEAPNDSSGTHRYVALLYEQKAPEDLEAAKITFKSRREFNFMHFKEIFELGHWAGIQFKVVA